ncbi:hypothetical protein DPMN_171414 [Dreissena polymorpha]|uniref:Uncharacterized protein n=1 Tax=Dreissena polymorpha TaxID=45954 RepID=A0A9D4E1N6_DREPO|nr:hypothetical protein DPMN_171414 [Dreissena polymorpha]
MDLEKWGCWRKSGIPCVVFNTKLETASVDSLDGPSGVNTMLSTINLKTISDTNLKIMEQPAGEVIEQVATESARIAASDAFLNEMTPTYASTPPPPPPHLTSAIPTLADLA